MIEWKALTAYEFINLIITFLGFCVVGFSLFYLNRQTKLLGKNVEHLEQQTGLLAQNVKHLDQQTELLAQNVESNTYASITNNLALTKRIFIEHPDLRKYFYDGIEISENDSAYQKVISITEHLLDFFDGVLLQKRAVWDVDLWKAYIKSSFENSPILRQYLEERKGWYNPELVEVMNQSIRNPEEKGEIDGNQPIQKEIPS